ncbi:MAG: type transport system ATP-binding protein [Actinomycetota bacterium]|nr:type transport system ATP-binding protein [Actinomycetota bacterium]
MITVAGLKKRYGSTLAVNDLSFTVRPGHVTGFLGPNGAGKSTTMRMILGLDRPDAGSATVDGRPYSDHPNPARVVGALLSAERMHPQRTARGQLEWIAQATRVPDARIDVQLEEVGLGGVGERRVEQLSLGMRQRLGIAAALMTEPRVLILDEPLNGLDPEGILWLRGLLRDFAKDGRAVLVSSHLMNEMQKTADHVIVIRKGELVADSSLAELERHLTTSVVARGPDLSLLADALHREGVTVEVNPGQTEIVAHGVEARHLSELSIRHAVVLDSLGAQGGSLEDAFLALTRSPKES